MAVNKVMQTASIILEGTTAGFISAIFDNIEEKLFKVFNKIIFLLQKNVPKKKSKLNIFL